MRRLIYLTAARRDFSQISDYIARESGSRATARRFVESLIDQCEKLARLPGTLGRARPELLDGLRSFAFGNYVIFFSYEPGHLTVARIIEGHRDIAATFDEPTT